MQPPSPLFFPPYYENFQRIYIEKNVSKFHCRSLKEFQAYLYNICLQEKCAFGVIEFDCITYKIIVLITLWSYYFKEQKKSSD